MSWDETYGTAGEHLGKLLPLLEEKGAALLVAGYSGGNGAGGVNYVELYAEKTGDNPDAPVGQDSFDYTAASAMRPGGWREPIFDLCESILTAHFGSWGGDWSAAGSLFVDVAARRCWKVGRMQVWAEDGERLDVTLA